MAIFGNMIGGAAPLKTLIIEDENGNEITGVVVGQEVVFTATDNDVREGHVYAGDGGVSVGTKNIPAYRTTKKSTLVLPGENFSIDMSEYEKYNYTQLLAIISKFNTSFFDSVETDKIALGDYVYNVNSTDILSNITKNSDNKSIDFNINNNTEDIYIIHCFTYKEEV